MKISPLTLVLTTFALTDAPQEDKPTSDRDIFATSHKDKQKREKTPRAKKTGRGKPAKGYDPVTKKWSRL